jgi:hypothetical protein
MRPVLLPWRSSQKVVYGTGPGPGLDKVLGERAGCVSSVIPILTRQAPHVARPSLFILSVMTTPSSHQSHAIEPPS